MPTTLPHTTTREWRQRRPSLAELASVAVALFYLLLLAWNMASLEANFSLLLGQDHRQGEYNPMEPSRLISGRNQR